MHPVLLPKLTQSFVIETKERFILATLIFELGPAPSCHTKARLCRRPVDKDVMAKMSFPKVKNVWTVDNKLGGWEKLQHRFFDDKVGASCRLTALLRPTQTAFVTCLQSPPCLIDLSWSTDQTQRCDCMNNQR